MKIVLDWDYETFSVQQEGRRVRLWLYDTSPSDAVVEVSGIGIFQGVEGDKFVEFSRMRGNNKYRPTPAGQIVIDAGVKEKKARDKEIDAYFEKINAIYRKRE